jgi:copper(I)-binding protein
MLLGLTRELKPGETVPVTLTFERAGAVTVDATVR